MKLVSVSISAYRSILKTEKLSVENFTVLVGPNNEGKSNILRGIALALEAVRRIGEGTLVRRVFRRRYGLSGAERYSWQSDYPVQQQAKTPDGRSVFLLEFSLTEEEQGAFWHEVASNWQTNLRVRVSMGPEGTTTEIVTPGKAKQIAAKKLTLIAKFISNHLRFTYVPAVRTAEAANETVEAMVHEALRPVYESESYREGVRAIAKLQQPVLTKLSEAVMVTLREFMPEVRHVEIQTIGSGMSALRDVRVMIDDGQETALEAKGDGVQSLATLALLRPSELATGRGYILAIEEPESHLHSEAIHRLRDTLISLSELHQVIITTHSPLLVPRLANKGILLVRDSTAKPAKSIRDVRKALGVRVSDNLATATLVLLVEGANDVSILTAFLESSETLKEAMAKGVLSVQTLGGASNLAHMLRFYTSVLCGTYCFLDNDKEALDALAECRTAGLLKESDYTLSVVRSLRESEIEDLISVDVYRSRLESEFGVSILESDITQGSGKWSVRVRELVRGKGKAWDQGQEDRAKSIVATEVARAGRGAISTGRDDPIVALVRALECRIIGD